MDCLVDLSRVDRRFIKFLAVGGLNTIFGYSVYSLLLYIGLHYSLAVLLGTILGVMFNFQTTGKLVFNNKKNILIFKFAGVYCILYFINTTFLYIFNSFKFNMYFAGAIMILPMALMSFTLIKKLVFQERK